MRPIKIDRREGEMEVVSEGLRKGETVVTDGQLMLSPGAKFVTREQLEKMMGKTPSKKAPLADEEKSRRKEAQDS
jgi:hypothetical protein